MTTSTFVLTEEHVQANNLLKIMWLVESSWAWKEVIRLWLVSLNGTRLEEMRKKLHAGDVLLFDDNTITILSQTE